MNILRLILYNFICVANIVVPREDYIDQLIEQGSNDIVKIYEIMKNTGLLEYSHLKNGYIPDLDLIN